MSTSRITRAFHCSNDCRQTGCPGHLLTLAYYHSSDTVGIECDGEDRGVFDLNEWRALVNMDDALRHPAPVAASVASRIDPFTH